MPGGVGSQRWTGSPLECLLVALFFSIISITFVRGVGVSAPTTCEIVEANGHELTRGGDQIFKYLLKADGPEFIDKKISFRISIARSDGQIASVGESFPCYVKSALFTRNSSNSQQSAFRQSDSSYFWVVTYDIFIALLSIGSALAALAAYFDFFRKLRKT